LVDRNKIKPELIDDVIFGCVSQVGAQSGNIARNAILSSKLPITVPGVTVDRQCGSGQQAMHFAAQAVMSGSQDIVIAGGVENMTMVPIGAGAVDGMKAGHGHPYESKGIQEAYPNDWNFSQFGGAELLAKKYDITREELDEFGCESVRRAVEATKNGHFKREIVPMKGSDKDGKPVDHVVDEGIRADTNLEGMKKLKLLNPDGGRHTAATSSQICDGAAALLVCNENGLKKLGLKPRAKIVAMALAGSDPVIMLEGPIPATRNVLKAAGMKLSDIDVFEVNEAFGAVPLAWAKALGADKKKLNVNGGAQALGHPLGATGAKLTATLINEMERRKVRYGLLAICEGGGTANATVFERVDTSLSKL